LRPIRIIAELGTAKETWTEGCLWRASGFSAIGTSQRGGRNPARVTVTSRRTAASDGKLLAAVRAWRQ